MDGSISNVGKHLQHILQRCLSMSFPLLAREVQELLNQQALRLPAKHVVSKYRLCFDVAYMLLVRDRVAAALHAMRKFSPDKTDGEWLREGRFVGHLTDSSDLWGGGHIL